MDKHDNHYKETEKKGIEPVALMETVISRKSLPLLPRLHIAMAVRYLFRTGTKGDWRTDTEKALNHVTRALTGEWIKEKEKKPAPVAREVKAPVCERWELMKAFNECGTNCAIYGAMHILTENTGLKEVLILQECDFIRIRSANVYKLDTTGKAVWNLWKGVPPDKWHIIELFERIARENGDGLCASNGELEVLASAGLVNWFTGDLTQKGRDFWALWSKLPEKW